MKTHKGIAKRMKVTACGKIKRRRSGGRHLMSGKSSKRRRRLRGTAVITGTTARQIRSFIQA